MFSVQPLRPGKKRASLGGAVMATLIALFTLSAMSAGAAELEDFYGRWVGSGILTGTTEIDPEFAVRDLDVIIRDSGDGFLVCWITLKRERRAEGRAAERAVTRIRFEPASGEDIYRAPPRRGSEGAFSAWAELREESQLVFTQNIDEEGHRELQIYDRSPVNADTMRLDFSRLDNEILVRNVRGELSKLPGAGADSVCSG